MMHAALRVIFDFLMRVKENPLYDKTRECLLDQTGSEEISFLETSVSAIGGLPSYTLTGRLGSRETWVQPGTSDKVRACIWERLLKLNGEKKQGFQFAIHPTGSGEFEVIVTRSIPVPEKDDDKIAWYIALREDYCLFMDDLPALLEEIKQRCDES
jgi:hypothetical protein